MSNDPKLNYVDPLGVHAEPEDKPEELPETTLEAIQREAHYCRGKADALFEVAELLKANHAKRQNKTTWDDTT